MRRLRFVGVGVFLCLAFGSGVGQARQGLSAPASAQQDPVPGGSGAASDGVVYFYRYKQFMGSGLEPSIYCDDVELARMDNGRFFAVKLPLGDHTCRSNDKQSRVRIVVKPGQEYFLRVEIATGFWKGHGRLVLVQPEQGASELAELKPLGADKIRDKAHVNTELTPTSVASR